MITELTVSIAEHPGIRSLGSLHPSAQYNLPIEDLRVGDSKSIHVSHLIEANKADRFLVAFNNNRALKVKLTITYNRNQTVSETVWFWIVPQRTPTSRKFR